MPQFRIFECIKLGTWLVQFSSSTLSAGCILECSRVQCAAQREPVRGVKFNSDRPSHHNLTTSLHCTVLYSTALYTIYCTVLHCTALFCNELKYTACLYFTQLHGSNCTVTASLSLHHFYYTAPHHTKMHFSALNCTALNCTTLYCTNLRRTALHCPKCTLPNCTSLLFVSLHCCKLHCSAVQCYTEYIYSYLLYITLYTNNKDCKP